MSETPNDGAGRPDEAELRKMLAEAMDKEPGLMRKIVHEALARQDQIEKASGKATAMEAAQPQPSGAPDAPPEPPKRNFKAEVREQAIKLPNAQAAQTLRDYLRQYEAEAVVFEGNEVILVRSRAFAIETPVEEKKDEQPGTNPAVPGADGGSVNDGKTDDGSSTGADGTDQQSDDGSDGPEPPDPIAT